LREVLEIQNLSKKYGKITAVSNLNLVIKEGDVCGILGPNGSGKTTSLAMILGIVKPDYGNYKWFGEFSSSDIRKKIGALIETPNFYPYMSLKRNLEIVASIKGVDYSDIDRVLSLVNLSERKKSDFSTLSLGMKQRVALASLLLGDPEILVLDEPTNGLDPEGIAEVRSIIKQESQKGKTIILASHILDEVEKVCSHVAVMKKGVLIANGRVNELLSSDDQIIISTERISDLYDLLSRSGMTSKIDQQDYELILNLEKGYTTTMLNEFAFKNGHVLSKIQVNKKSLESQFLELVK